MKTNKIGGTTWCSGKSLDFINNNLSRVIRLRDAPAYLGMNKNLFNKEVRPFLIEIPIGKQGVGFDRLDLDRFIDDYKSRVGRPGSKSKENQQCLKSHQALRKEKASGTLTKSSKDEDFMKALEQAYSKKQ